jgi:hypothetical protein
LEEDEEEKWGRYRVLFEIIILARNLFIIACKHTVLIICRQLW